jgi:hypothetical protein
VNGDELGVVREGGPYGATSSTVSATPSVTSSRENSGTEAYQVGNAAPVAGAFLELGIHDGHRLGAVGLQTAVAPAPGHLGGGDDHGLLLLPGLGRDGLLLSSLQVRF